MRFGGLFHGFSFGVGFELMRRVVAPAILALCILGVWWWLGPEKPSCDSARQHVARSAVEHAVTRIRAEQGDVRRAAVLHARDDLLADIAALPEGDAAELVEQRPE